MNVKNFYIISLFFLVLLPQLHAQDSVNVILAVDMSAVTINAPGVHVAGNFQDNFAGTTCSEWDAGCTALTESTDTVNQSGIWSIRLRLPKDMYQYKFINDNSFDNGNDEGSGLSADCGVDDGFGNFNRSLDLTNAPSDIDTVIAFVFNSCDMSEAMITSIDENFRNALQLKVFPNPSSASFQISFENPRLENLNLSLIHINGQKVLNQNFTTANELKIERGNLSAGIYFLSLENENGLRVTQKVVLR
ncbi:MAG: T9SS type A sorting domain-containing protein [Bacteroidia bacterium]|nr:T9SS type A sorting domain-containing protein [Bacteroidia bacterium]